MGTTGRLRLSGCQESPASNETWTVRSVPAYRSPARPGSSRITRVKSLSGIPDVIRVHVSP